MSSGSRRDAGPRAAGCPGLHPARVPWPWALADDARALDYSRPLPGGRPLAPSSVPDPSSPFVPAWWTRAHDAWLRSWRALLVYGLVYASLHVLSIRLPSEALPIAPLWPPAGALVAGLVLMRSTPRWMILTATFVAARVASNPTALPSTRTLLLFGASCVEGLTASGLLVRLAGPAVSFTRMRDVLALLAATAVAVTLNSVLAGAIVAETGSQFWAGFVPSWIGGSLGILLFTPLLVAWRSVMEPPSGPAPRGAGVGEATALALVTIVLSQLAFRGLVVAGLAALPPLALVVPIVWGAVRFGLRGVTALVLVVVILATPLQLEPDVTVLGGATPDARLLRLQGYIAALTMTGLVVSAALGERRRRRAGHAAG